MKNYLLQALISKYQYISFDIFDTLIERKVKAPSDIFAIVGKIFWEMRVQMSLGKIELMQN